MFPCLPKEVGPSRHLDQLGGPVPRSHERLEPSDAGHCRPLSHTLQSFGDGEQLLLESIDYLSPCHPDIELIGNPENVIPDVIQTVRLQADDVRMGRNVACHCRLDILQTDGIHITLGLGEDVRWLQLIQGILEDIVNGHGPPQHLLYTGVNFAAVPRNREVGCRAHRKRGNRSGEIALVRTSYLVLTHSQDMDDLSGAGNERHDTGHIFLAPCIYRPLWKFSWRRLLLMLSILVRSLYYQSVLRGERIPAWWPAVIFGWPAISVSFSTRDTLSGCWFESAPFRCPGDYPSAG